MGLRRSELGLGLRGVCVLAFGENVAYGFVVGEDSPFGDFLVSDYGFPRSGNAPRLAVDGATGFSCG